MLKACPFCGGGDLKSGGDDKIVGTWCLSCQASGPNQYITGEDWQNRPIEDALRLRISELEQFVLDNTYFLKNDVVSFSYKDVHDLGEKYPILTDVHKSYMDRDV